MSKSSTASARALARIILLAFLALLVGAPTAYAQDEISDFFGRIFGGGSSSQSAGRGRSKVERQRRISPRASPRTPSYGRSQRDGGGARRSATRSAPERPDAPAVAEPAAPKTVAYFRVATIGDTLGMQLADGLDEAYANRPEIEIIHKGKESSGLVRDDFYDWPKTAREIAAGAAPKIDLAVIMIGGNDRQSISDGGEAHEPLSDRWRQIYGARIDAVMAAFKEKGVPLVWVGLPVMKNQRFSADMARFNEIYRDRAARNGVSYIDVWEAFGDEHGHFQVFGPDVNGESVKIRAADGVHFTEAGARTLALFVEKEIKRVFEARYPPGSAPSAALQPAAPAAPGAAIPSVGAPPAPVVIPSPVAPVTTAAPVLPERPAIGPAQPLTPAAVDARELARRGQPTPAPAEPQGAAARALAEHVFVEGKDQPARPNRADDFSWRGAPAK